MKLAAFRKKNADNAAVFSHGFGAMKIHSYSIYEKS